MGVPRQSETVSASREAMPLTPAMVHITLALAAGARHGYALMREVAEMTDADVNLGPATLYRSLGRLEAAGYIEQLADIAAEGDDERRRYWRLTSAGREALRAEIARMQRLVNEARRRSITS
jgi:DNA-binding PadR family transcriptional regulator